MSEDKRRFLHIGLIVLILLLLGRISFHTYERSTKLERERRAKAAQAAAAASLRMAVREGKVGKLGPWIRRIDPSEPQARVALDEAAYYGRTDMVQLLLERGWEVKGTKGAAALGAAACYGYTDIVQLLLSRGVDVNAPAAQSALGWASYSGHTDTVKILLEAGADVNTPAQIDTGGTPLMLAARRGHVDIVKLLLSHHADVRFKSERGETALSLAKQRENPVQKGDAVGREGDIAKEGYAASDPTPERAQKNRKSHPKDERRIAAIVQMLRAAGATE
jgi:hypothetical protein